MDTTVRNLDDDAYRSLKAHAALCGKSVGEVLSEAIRVFLAQQGRRRKKGSLMNLPHEDFGPGTEHLSEEIDKVVYGL